MRAVLTIAAVVVTAASVHAAMPDLDNPYVPAVPAPKLATPPDRWETTTWEAVPPRPRAARVDRPSTCPNRFRDVRRGQRITWRLVQDCPSWRVAAFQRGE